MTGAQLVEMLRNAAKTLKNNGLSGDLHVDHDDLLRVCERAERMERCARDFRDTLCRTLDGAERRAKRGEPLPQDEIDAMTARLVETTAALDAE